LSYGLCYRALFIFLRVARANSICSSNAPCCYAYSSDESHHISRQILSSPQLPMCKLGYNARDMFKSFAICEVTSKQVHCCLSQPCLMTYHYRGTGTMALKQFSKKEEFERVNMSFTMQNIPPSSYDLQLRTLKPWFHRRLVPDMDLKPR
jgi:hypothetical protein